MTRRRKASLRPITVEERTWLEQISRATSEPASHVARARALLAVADGQTYQAAAQAAGRRSNDAVAQLVARFNQLGLDALVPGHGGGPDPTYTSSDRTRILDEARRMPDREADGAAIWSLTTLQRALRRAPDGLPKVSTATIWAVLHDAGWSWQQSRTWCDTGKALRKRKSGLVEVTDPDAESKKNLIERAYTVGEALGLAVWGQDEAGPFQTEPYAAGSWAPETRPARYPHEHQRNGTAKLLTLFHPATGEVRVKGVTTTVNPVLHGWLKAQLTEVLAALPELPPTLSPEETQFLWAHWQEGLTVRVTLPSVLPPLRMLLVWDNLAGLKTPELVLWLFSQGIMPLYTPLSGSWLNMTESVQRILKRRALEGHHPKDPQETIAWLEATARGWNAHPTPFVWHGKRATRRARSHARRHAIGGSGACTRRPVRRRTSVEEWRRASQVTH